MSAEVYERYTTALTAIPEGVMMPYRWSKLPEQLNAIWLPYGLMLDEFSSTISNGINQLTDYIRRLRAWDVVIAGMNDQELMATRHAFIAPVAIVALTLPYVIQNRFLFAAAHLCHQANFALNPDAWKDDLRLDTDINQQDADRAGAGWRKYNRFKTRLEGVDSRAYRDATRNYRNAYTHRFPPEVIIGYSNIVTRRVDPTDKKTSYAVGGLPPLSLSTIADALTEQADATYKTFEAFQQLVHEHKIAMETI